MPMFYVLDSVSKSPGFGLDFFIHIKTLGFGLKQKLVSVKSLGIGIVPIWVLVTHWNDGGI